MVFLTTITLLLRSLHTTLRLIVPTLLYVRWHGVMIAHVVDHAEDMLIVPDQLALLPNRASDTWQPITRQADDGEGRMHQRTLSLSMVQWR